MSKQSKRRKDDGWKTGTVAEFLEMTPEEEALMEMMLALSRGVRHYRNAEGINQTELAERMGSSQSRVALVERGDKSVSMQLTLRALLALGCSRAQIADLVANGPPSIQPHEPPKKAAINAAANPKPKKKAAKKRKAATK